MNFMEREITKILPVVLVGILLVFSGAMIWKENRVVNKIIVKGNETIPVEEVIELANVKIGEKITGLNLSEIRNRIEKHKFVKYADVYTNLPDVVFIEIVERKPIAMITYNGKIYYVDSDGFVVSSDGIKKIFSVPLLSGISYKPVNVSSDSLGQLRRQFELIKLAIDKKVYDLISEVKIKDEEVVVLTTEGAVPIFLGRDGFEKKFVVLRKFWEQYVSKRGFPSYIDLRYEGKLYANFDSKN